MQGSPSPEALRRALADLSFLISGPSLMSSAQLQRGADELLEGPLSYPVRVLDEAARAPWSRALREPQIRARLEEHLSDELARLPSRRIGVYAERLLVALLSALPSCSLLAHDLKLYTENPPRRTIGALDFLMRGPRGVEHWELTVKFYLQRAHDDGWGGWLGPNERDTMALKMRKLLSHQLPLSQLEPIKRQLEAQGLPCPQERGVICVGWLFREWRAEGPPPPCEMSPQRVGLWLRRGAWAAGALRAQDEPRWVTRPYPDWLHSDPELLAERPRLTALEVLEQPLERGRHLMLSELDERGHELQRWMLVSDDWGAGGA